MLLMRVAEQLLAFLGDFPHVCNFILYVQGVFGASLSLACSAAICGFLKFDACSSTKEVEEDCHASNVVVHSAIMECASHMQAFTSFGSHSF